MRTALIGLAFGTAFGALLAWGGMSDPAVIEDMLLFRSVDLFLLMGSAMAVAGVGARILRRARARSLVGGTEIEWTSTRPTTAHVGGSALFGIGWAVSLTCPGPLAAQIGSGNAAAVATGLGVLGGIFLAGWWRARATAARTSTAMGAAAIGL
ncbi:MAG: YeeE/YedE family protein [Deltaproteobacteria bacterium]|nr:YeeE/YedE family protein [Deltaproteobacteria bacterium]